MLAVQIFGWEIDTALFIASVTALSGFAWWLIAIYIDVHDMKKASMRRGKQIEILIIKQEALVETLGSDEIEFGRKFKHEYEKNINLKIQEYNIEAAA